MPLSESKRRILNDARENFLKKGYDPSPAYEIILKEASERFKQDGPFDRITWTMRKLSDGILVMRNLLTNDIKKISYVVHTSTGVAIRLERDNHDFIIVRPDMSCAEYFAFANLCGMTQRTELFYSLEEMRQ